jgi:hypothetical protein
MGHFTKIPPYYMIPDGAGHWMSHGELQFYSLQYDEYITVPYGTVNDLASIPRLFRRMFNVNGPHRPAAALHDFLYGVGGKLPNRQFSRKECDKIFKEAMLSSKHSYYNALYQYTKWLLSSTNLTGLFIDNYNPLVDSWQAEMLYSAVRIGGASSFDKG